MWRFQVLWRIRCGGHGERNFQINGEPYAPARTYGCVSRYRRLTLRQRSASARDYFWSPLRAAFGSGYEVIFRGQNGFERVDDVLHVFALVRVLGSRLEIEHYPYAIRQWYEGNQLFIGSFVTPEAALQGLGYHSFVIPSVLEEPRDTERSVDSLRERPKYMCMHHVFLTPGGWIPSTLTMRGDGIDEMFLIHQNGSEIKFEHTASYEERLRQQVSKLPN
jgi:hypothetical protein